MKVVMPYIFNTLIFSILLLRLFINKMETNASMADIIACIRKGLVNESNSDNKKTPNREYTNLIYGFVDIFKLLKIIRRIKLKTEKIPSVQPIILKIDKGFTTYSATAKADILQLLIFFCSTHRNRGILTKDRELPKIRKENAALFTVCIVPNLLANHGHRGQKALQLGYIAKLE